MPTRKTITADEAFYANEANNSNSQGHYQKSKKTTRFNRKGKNKLDKEIKTTQTQFRQSQTYTYNKENTNITKTTTRKI